MHKVTKPATSARVFVEIAASSLTKVGHGAEFHLHFSSVVESAVHDVECISSFFFVMEFGVDVSDHVVAEVVADVEGFKAAEFGEFFEEVSA